MSGEIISLLATSVIDKNLRNIFASLSKKTDEQRKEKKKLVGDDLGICVLKLLLEVTTLPNLVAISLVKEEK